MAELLEEATTTALAHPSATEPPTADAVRAHRGVTVAYVLGISVQVVLWSLVFLALAVAIATGGHLTEFRYVGF